MHPRQDSQPTGSTDTHISEGQNIKRMDTDEETSASDMLSPISAEADKQEDRDLPPALGDIGQGSPSMGYDFSNVRVCATIEPFLVLE